MSTLEMKRLKGLLQDSAVKLSGDNSVSFGAVIQSLRKSDADAIQAVTTELEDGMMHRLLSQIATRKLKPEEGQPDLFAGYPGVLRMITVEIVRDGTRNIELKRLHAATINELANWLGSDHRSILTRRQRNPGMAKLLRECSKAAKGQHAMTVGQALKLLRKKGG